MSIDSTTWYFDLPSRRFSMIAPRRSFPAYQLKLDHVTELADVCKRRGSSIRSETIITISSSHPTKDDAEIVNRRSRNRKRSITYCQNYIFLKWVRLETRHQKIARIPRQYRYYFQMSVRRRSSDDKGSDEDTKRTSRDDFRSKCYCCHDSEDASKGESVKRTYVNIDLWTRETKAHGRVSWLSRSFHLWLVVRSDDWDMSQWRTT